MLRSSKTILVVGCGRAGPAVALAWRDAGAEVTLLCRDPQRRAAVQAWIEGALPLVDAPVQADIVVFAVPDREIASAAAAFPDIGSVWLHLSGAAPTSLLRRAGSSRGVGSLHPLCALPDPLLRAACQASKPLQGALMALDGDPQVLPLSRDLALSLGGEPALLGEEGRGLYHAAAALVANDLVVLIASGAELCAQAGLEPSVARGGLLHLAHTSLDALGAVPAAEPLVRGLTGAVARADAGTLARHLDVLAPWPDTRALHRNLSLRLVDLLVQAGRLAPPEIDALRKVLGD